MSIEADPIAPDPTSAEAVQAVSDWLTGEGNPKPAVANAGPGLLAVYTRKSNAGTLIAVITDNQWVTLVEKEARLERLEDAALRPDGSIAPTVRDVKSARNGRLAARRQKLVDKQAEITSKIADIDAKLT